MIYISLGVDCGTANGLKALGKRTCSLPFDWVVTYKGITNIVKNEFNNYAPFTKMNKTNKYLDDAYGVLFIHNNFPDDLDQIKKKN